MYTVSHPFKDRCLVHPETVPYGTVGGKGKGDEMTGVVVTGLEGGRDPSTVSFDPL